MASIDRSRSLSSASQTPPDFDPAVLKLATRRRYPANYKRDILIEYDTLDRVGKGRLLRREGLYTSLLSQWRKQRDEGALAGLAAKPGRPCIHPLERENARLRFRVERLETDLQRARQRIDKLEGLVAEGHTRRRQRRPHHQRRAETTAQGTR